jgi:hypothetical protein
MLDARTQSALASFVSEWETSHAVGSGEAAATLTKLAVADSTKHVLIDRIHVDRQSFDKHCIFEFLTLP